SEGRRSFCVGNHGLTSLQSSCLSGKGFWMAGIVEPPKVGQSELSTIVTCEAVTPPRPLRQGAAPSAQASIRGPSTVTGPGRLSLVRGRWRSEWMNLRGRGVAIAAGRIARRAVSVNAIDSAQERAAATGQRATLLEQLFSHCSPCAPSGCAHG